MTNILNTVFEVAGIAMLAGYMFGALGVIPAPIMSLLLTMGIPVVLAAMVGWFMFYDYKMAPVADYYGSWKPGKTLMLYTTKSGRAALRSDSKYIAGVYEISNEKKEELLAFSKNDKGALQFGESRMEIVYDGANMTIRPEYLLAVEALKRRGYNTIDQLQVAIEKGKFQNFVDEEIGIEVNLTNPGSEGRIYIPLYHSINPHEIAGYVLGSATIFKSFTDTKVTMERLKAAKTGLSDPGIQQMVMIIIVGALGLGILKITHVI